MRLASGRMRLPWYGTVVGGVGVGGALGCLVVSEGAAAAASP